MSEHEKAPGRGLLTDLTAAMPVDPPTTRGNLRFWSARGVTMSATGSTGPRVGGGVVEVDDLHEFTEYVRLRMPGATVLIHAHGLRAVEYDSAADAGPMRGRSWTGRTGRESTRLNPVVPVDRLVGAG